MPKYSTDIREVFEKQYIKVFLADTSDLEKVQKRLELIHSIRKVNISNDTRDLTVYAKQPFSAKEVEEHVQQVMEVFYSESENDTTVINELREIRESLPVSSKVRKCYNDALNKMIAAQYNRNCLDDIRLALELYLKEVLNNQNPLEKQNTALKDYLKRRGMSSELINVQTQSLSNLCHFFNNHTKHDYNVKREEVDTVVGFSNQIMRGLLNMQ